MLMVGINIASTTKDLPHLCFQKSSKRFSILDFIEQINFLYDNLVLGTTLLT